MDADLKCNRLTCRQSLNDKAVVTTCSHIFCVECANELFNTARLCPACDTSLTEPDDVVVCSLHPTNDYKTSVLSGLTPSIILEICTRSSTALYRLMTELRHKNSAISFWQYQIYQESSFQQAVVRNINDKNAQLQKQLESVVREANSEISLLNNKISELERDFELERRKNREVQDMSREREKEYQKLKLLHDKLKRKALLVPGSVSHEAAHNFSGGTQASHLNGARPGEHRTFGVNVGNNVNLGAVVGGMEASGVQRTPIINRTADGPFSHQGGWIQQPQGPQLTVQTHIRNKSHRKPFPLQTDRSYRSGNTSDRSESANEVEDMLIRQPGNTSWIPQSNQTNRTSQQGYNVAPQPAHRTSSKFRPAGGAGR